MATGPGIVHPDLWLRDQIGSSLHDGMVAWWDLDEASGPRKSRVDPGSATLADVNGVEDGAGIAAAGNVAAALFDAAAFQELQADNIYIGEFGDHDFTVAGWFYFIDLGIGSGLVAKWEGPGTNVWILYQDSTNLRFYVSDDGSTGYNVVDGTALATDTWYFVVGWYNKAEGTINIQVNNGTIYSLVHLTGITGIGLGSILRLGTNPEGGTWHEGKMDSVGLWDRVLTAEEKTLLYNNGAGYTFHRLSYQLREQGQQANSLGINGLGRKTPAETGNTEGEYFIERTTKVLNMNSPVSTLEQRIGPLVLTPKTEPGRIAEDLSQAWFELVHLFPKAIDFGQVLTTVTAEVELYNAFRKTNILLNTIVNNLGAGVGFNPPAPGLPFSILHLTSLVLTVEATQEGSPVFEGTIDFGLSIYTLELPIEGLRVIVFPYAPEVPLIETMRFLTDVLEKQGGTEQRINLRKAPRQTFDLRLVREGSVERSQIENLVFDWHARAFGIPVWYEPTELTADVLVGATEIVVKSTAYADYRVGDIAIILESESKYDALTVLDVDPTRLTLESGTLNAYSAGVRVYPLRVCLAERMIQGSRMQNNVADFFFSFTTQDNNVQLGSTAAFATYNGKVLLDDPNFLPDVSLEKNFEREMTRIDSDTGRFQNATPWAKDRHISFKGWAINGSRQKLWEVRQLLHALRGRQTSFYIPTFQHELIPTQQLTSGASGLQVTNVGYTRYVKNRSPKNIIRLHLADGSKLIRAITSSAEAGAVENLVVDSTWPSNVPIVNILKIEMLELVRLDADDIKIEHSSAVGDARLVVPVKSVFD